MNKEKIEEILSQWDNLCWRYHGTGILQAYISGYERIHIWHKSLLKDGIEESGAMHNHRFDFRSYILAGSIKNSLLEIMPAEDGTHELWDIVVDNKNRGGDFQKCSISPQKVVQHQTDILRRPSSYAMLKGEYHWARPHEDEIGITLIRLSNKDKDKYSRLLCPIGVIPVHAGKTVIPRDNHFILAAKTQLEIQKQSWTMV